MVSILLYTSGSADVPKTARRWYDGRRAGDMNTDAITASPDIQGGHAVIRGTRVPVHVLVSALADGASIPEVCDAYGVTEEHVRSALAYAAAALQEERVVALPDR